MTSVISVMFVYFSLSNSSSGLFISDCEQGQGNQINDSVCLESLITFAVCTFSPLLKPEAVRKYSTSTTEAVKYISLSF